MVPGTSWDELGRASERGTTRRSAWVHTDHSQPAVHEATMVSLMVALLSSALALALAQKSSNGPAPAYTISSGSFTVGAARCAHTGALLGSNL